MTQPSDKLPMTLEDQVCSLKLSKKLKELGMKQDSLFYWINERERNTASVWGDWYLEYVDKVPSSYLSNEEGVWKDHLYSAFTPSELGELIPWELKDNFDRGRFVLEKSFFVDRPWKATYFDRLSGGRLAEMNEDFTIANTMAKMLIYLLEKKLI